MSRHDDVGAYVLGALSPEERRDFERHLETCAQCREEVERLRVAADALGAAPEQLAPPPELKDRIMAVVRSEAELLRAAGPRADAPAPPPKRRRVWSLRPALAIAGAAAVLALGVLAGIVASGGVSGNEARTIAAQVSATGASAKLIERGSDHSTLVAARLPDPGPGRVYQVWLQTGNQAPRPTNALFGVRPDGSASVDVPGSLDNVDRVMVTSEPAGGSQAPTRNPIIIAST